MGFCQKLCVVWLSRDLGFSIFPVVSSSKHQETGCFLVFWSFVSSCLTKNKQTQNHLLFLRFGSTKIAVTGKHNTQLFAKPKLVLIFSRVFGFPTTMTKKILLLLRNKTKSSGTTAEQTRKKLHKLEKINQTKWLPKPNVFLIVVCLVSLFFSPRGIAVLFVCSLSLSLLFWIILFCQVWYCHD